MTREIKFRAWNNNQMWEVFNLYNPEEPNGTWPKDTILMQYTGLKADGKEIYGGDILNYINSENPEEYEVFWHKQRAGFKMKQIKGTAINTWKSINPENMQIIGNIYENPELIN